MTARDFGIRRLGAAIGAQAKRLARQFAGARRGNVAMMFALSLLPLSVLTFTAVDFHRASTVKNALQDALDAAALAAARSTSTNATEVQAIGQRVLNANMKVYPDARLSNVTFTLQNDSTVRASASVSVDPMAAGIFLGGPMQMAVSSEVKRSANDLEVALVLDTTGSMSGTPISDLRAVAN